jgi:hypothetical protein
MPKPLPDGLPESRHSYAEVVHEIRRQLDERGRGAYKDAAAACLMPPPAFSQRLRGKHSRLEVEHLGALADFLGAPKGWPLISWALAKDMADALKKATRK